MTSTLCERRYAPPLVIGGAISETRSKAERQIEVHRFAKSDDGAGFPGAAGEAGD
jgi:hypothetical protein